MFGWRRRIGYITPTVMQVVAYDFYRFARDVAGRAGAWDALYLPCPQWQASQVVPALEQDTGKPVIAYTHANFFVAFRALGLRDPIGGHGRLLASLASQEFVNAA